MQLFLGKFSFLGLSLRRGSASSSAKHALCEAPENQVCAIILRGQGMMAERRTESSFASEPIANLVSFERLRNFSERTESEIVFVQLSVFAASFIFPVLSS